MTDVINEYIDNIDAQWKIDIARRLHQMVREVIPGAEERIQYKQPHYLKNKKYAAVMNAPKNWVSFTIFNAGHLDYPQDQFELSNNGKQITYKIKQNQEADYAMLEDLLRQAAATLG